MSELKVYHGSYCEVDKPSLDNGRMDADFAPNKFDLLIGATADDKLFATIEQYESGFIDAETAVEVLNCMKVGQQICVRTESGLDNLHFSRSIELSPERVNELHEINKEDRKIANQLTSEIIRKRNKSLRR